MAIQQTVWSLDEKKELSHSTLLNENELENLLVENIQLLSSDWIVIGRQVHTPYGGIIDLLCIDIAGNPIVVELKKGMTPREVTAQALDYASWVKKLDADELAEIYLSFSHDTQTLNDAFRKRFGSDLNENNDDIDVQIVIVATDMDGSTERIIKYLQLYDIDINVLFFRVFEYNNQRFISRAWMFEPESSNRPQTTSNRSWNGEFYFSFGADKDRIWEDAVKFGFVCAGGGSWYYGTMQMLEVNDRIWVNIPHKGYVGVGIVIEKVIKAADAVFNYDGKVVTFYDLPLKGEFHRAAQAGSEEYVVKVKWLKTVAQSVAISEFGFFGNQNTVYRPKSDKWEFTIRRLKELWKIQ